MVQLRWFSSRPGRTLFGEAQSGEFTSVIEELVLVRHGESEGNVAAAAAHAAGAEQIVLPYRDPDVPLSAVGVDQAAALGAGLAPLSVDDVALWSSPYVRALQTAQVALAAAGSDVPIIADERLRDRELGILDLLTNEGVARHFPLEAQRRQWWGKFYHRPPGGESWTDVALRLRSFLGDLPAATDAERVVLVVHDAVVMLIRYLLEGLDEHTVLQLEAADPVKNASITVLRREAERLWRLERYNDVSHLEQRDAPITEHGGEPDVVH
jgi:broad specificity phosphatase PhoE